MRGWQPLPEGGGDEERQTQWLQRLEESMTGPTKDKITGGVIRCTVDTD